MTSALRKVASIALGATALIAITQSNAQASNVDLSSTFYVWNGPTSPAGLPLYGTASSQNNVVNAIGPTNGLLDTTLNPAQGTASSVWRTGGASTTLTAYTIQWYFAGAESGVSSDRNELVCYHILSFSQYYF